MMPQYCWLKRLELCIVHAYIIIIYRHARKHTANQRQRDVKKHDLVGTTVTSPIHTFAVRIDVALTLTRAAHESNNDTLEILTVAAEATQSGLVTVVNP